MAVTFFLVVIGWIIFRAENMSSAYHYIARMFTTPWTDFSAKMFIDLAVLKDALIGCAIMILVEWIQRRKEHGLELWRPAVGRYQQVALCYALIFLILLFGEFGENQFIYFQF